MNHSLWHRGFCLIGSLIKRCFHPKTIFCKCVESADQVDMGHAHMYEVTDKVSCKSIFLYKLNFVLTRIANLFTISQDIRPGNLLISILLLHLNKTQHYTGLEKFCKTAVFMWSFIHYEVISCFIWSSSSFNVFPSDIFMWHNVP